MSNQMSLVTNMFIFVEERKTFTMFVFFFADAKCLLKAKEHIRYVPQAMPLPTMTSNSTESQSNNNANNNNNVGVDKNNNNGIDNTRSLLAAAAREPDASNAVGAILRALLLHCDQNEVFFRTCLLLLLLLLLFNVVICLFQVETLLADGVLTAAVDVNNAHALRAIKLALPSSLWTKVSIVFVVVLKSQN
jgi:hypothetical protein